MRSEQLRSQQKPQEISSRRSNNKQHTEVESVLSTRLSAKVCSLYFIPLVPPILNQIPESLTPTRD